MGSEFQEQPVPGKDGPVPQVAAVSHKEQESPRQGAAWWVRDLDRAASPTRRDDGYAMRPHHRSLKVAGPRQEAMPG